VDAVSFIRNLRTRHAVVTKHPPNMAFIYTILLIFNVLYGVRLSFWNINAVKELRCAVYLGAHFYGTLSGVESCVSCVFPADSLWQLTYRLAGWQCIAFVRASHMKRQNPTTKDAYGNIFCFYKGRICSILIGINKANVNIVCRKVLNENWQGSS
jgi:hypothetical protein